MKTEYRITFSGATPVETIVQIRIEKPATAAGIQCKISTFPAHMYRLSFASCFERPIPDILIGTSGPREPGKKMLLF